MNIFVPIEYDWSFKFFEFNKPAISKLDFFTFCDDFYKAAMLYLEAHLNYNYRMMEHTFAAYMTKVDAFAASHPDLAGKIQECYRRLLHDYRNAYSALQGLVVRTKPIVEPSGLLRGIVFEVDREWPLRQ
jgi:hypothetical protein